MVSDWTTTNVHRDLPPAVWQFIKDKRLLGNEHRRRNTAGSASPPTRTRR